MATEDEHDTDDLEEESEVDVWDAVDVLRSRAASSRAERDEAIADLRQSMTDGEFREDFGIDLREIEG